MKVKITRIEKTTSNIDAKYLRIKCKKRYANRIDEHNRIIYEGFDDGWSPIIDIDNGIVVNLVESKHIGISYMDGHTCEIELLDDCNNVIFHKIGDVNGLLRIYEDKQKVSDLFLRGYCFDLNIYPDGKIINWEQSDIFKNIKNGFLLKINK